MEMSVSIGVIGAGVHGMHHVRLLSGMDDITFAGIYDIDPAVRKDVGAEFNITAFDSLDSLLAEVDCVSVAVPTSMHYDVVMRCFDAGVSVLVEKPIASTVVEADEMIVTAKKNGLVFGVGHIERFNPAYRSIAQDDLKPVFIESHRLAAFNPRGTDVAVVLDLMIHDIDIVLNMVKRPVKSVQAVGVNVVSGEVDISNARIEFEGGCVANLTTSRISQRKMRKVRVFQKNAYVSMDFLTGETEVFRLKPGTRPEALPGAIPQSMDGIAYLKHPNDGGNALLIELADFIEAVKNGTAPRVTAEDGRYALEVATLVMEGMEASARSLE